MRNGKTRPNVSIRIDPQILLQAKIEAVKTQMTLGQWLEAAIQEKVEKKELK
jgi:predicted HicB family RNase H-like nuclease